MNNRKNDWKKRLNYEFDNFISKGFWAQFLLLFIVILIFVVVFGIIAGLISQQFGIQDGLWQALMHIIDQGTIVGDDPADVGFVALMLFVTFLGMAFTGTIVGIINNAMTDKLNDLRKGHSQIMEEGHIVVIGFDNNIFTILDEIEESNENWEGNRTVVVLDDKEIDEMEHKIKAHRASVTRKMGPKANATNIILRSGNLVSENTYAIASIEKAKSIIVNHEDDFTVIRIILALEEYMNSYVERTNDTNRNHLPTIVTLMHKEENITAAKIAAGLDPEKSTENTDKGKIQVLYFENIIAHIFAQVCRQPGLSRVISEIFNYSDSEIYIEDTLKNKTKMSEVFLGKTFRQISEAMSTSIPIGIWRNGKAHLNPHPDNTVFEQGDKMIHLAVDDHMAEVSPERIDVPWEEPFIDHTKKVTPYHFVIFGWSYPLPALICNIDGYAPEGSTITVLTNRSWEELMEQVRVAQKTEMKNMDTEAQTEEISIAVQTVTMDPYHWKSVETYLNERMGPKSDAIPTNMVILCDDSIDKVAADEKTAVLLINIREYLRKRSALHDITVTTEMNLPEDQALLASTSSTDFIVGSEIANQMMVQVANDPDMSAVFHELLNNIGSEIYLRKFNEYIDVTEKFTFRQVRRNAMNRTSLGMNKHEVVLGWIYLGDEGKKPRVYLNPDKDMQDCDFDTILQGDSFRNYRVVVIAKE